ncbi:AraC family transcriptional regulator [Klebsiella pneumoniae]|nr:AraC family transcriptional regulator [Klebsiella pneumoniae]
MYAVLMKQMLYLKMLAWLEDNIYCNPAIDDLALYMGYSRRFVYDVFLPVWPVTHRAVYSSAAVDHRSGQSALNTTTDRRYCLAVKL